MNSYNVKHVDFDTKNIIIIFLGAFSGLDIIRDKRLNSNPLGFSIKEETHKSKAKFLKQDLVKYGLPEEFVGRIDTIVEMNELTKKDLALILKESELSIFKRYQNELSNMGITLIYNDDLFESIAEKSLVLDTGELPTPYAIFLYISMISKNYILMLKFFVERFIKLIQQNFIKFL